MRIPGRTILTACTVALAAGFLAGCTPTHPITEPAKTPKPTPTPVFTSDADALAAATKVYKRFLAASDVVGHDGGRDPERVSDLVGPEVLEAERAQARKLEDANARSYGETEVSNTQLQSLTQHGDTAEVVIYACEDLTDVEVRDSDGKSLIDNSRSDLVAYQVTLRGTAPDALKVMSNKFWAGGSVCTP
jgi:hypothetical protein